MRRGVTLLELLISLAIVVLVTMASTRAYQFAITVDQRLRDSRQADLERRNFEDTVINYLHHAWLSSSTTNPNSFFIGEPPTVTAATAGLPAGLQNTLGTSATPGGALSSGSGGGASQGSGTGAYGTPNILVFTAGGMPLPSAYIASNDDSETLNQNFGPVGGIQEVEISQSAVGSQGQSKTGVFLRVQIPADNDPTQGGNETLITAKLTQLGFEMFDGETWQTSWDSRAQTPKPGKLPAAVRVTYRMQGDDTDHIFIVQLPSSTTNYQSIVTVTG